MPDTPEFDVDMHMKLTRKQTNEMKKLFVTDRNHYKLIPHSTPFDYLPLKLKKHEDAQLFELYFRIVRFKVNENLYETVLTNLDKNDYTPEKLKELYNSR